MGSSSGSTRAIDASGGAKETITHVLIDFLRFTIKQGKLRKEVGEAFPANLTVAVVASPLEYSS
jgi:hypothetical protein